MTFEKLDLPGLRVIEPPRFGDDRGFFSETYKARDLAELGVRDVFVQDNHSWSRAVGVLRGLHFQLPPMSQAKLVRVIRGRALDVAVDLRRGSPTYGRSALVELSAANWRQLYVPVGFAHGFLTLEPDTEVQYKVSAYYSPEHEKGLMWNDPGLNIVWPIANSDVILSEKDKRHAPFAHFDSPWTYGSGGA